MFAGLYCCGLIYDRTLTNGSRRAFSSFVRFNCDLCLRTPAECMLSPPILRACKRCRATRDRVGGRRPRRRHDGAACHRLRRGAGSLARARFLRRRVPDRHRTGLRSHRQQRETPLPPGLFASGAKIPGLDRDARDHALRLRASGRGAVRACYARRIVFLGLREKAMKRGKSVDFTGYWQRHIAD